MSDDLISRQAAIRWVKTECNPYGKPTLDFESGKKVIEHLEQMSPAQPEIIYCENCIHYKFGMCRHAMTSGVSKSKKGFCDWWDRREVTE